MRGFFAHETVHAWQGDETPQALADPLLSQAPREGVADSSRALATGEVPHLERDAWARQRESWRWHAFQRDRGLLADSDSVKDSLASPRFRRWFANCGSALRGWPCEAVLDRHAYRRSYLARASDKRAALRELLVRQDPAAILKASGYDGQAATTRCRSRRRGALCRVMELRPMASEHASSRR